MRSVARRSGWDALALTLCAFVPLGFLWLATFLAGGPDDPTAADAVLLGAAATWIASIAAIVLLLRAGRSPAWLALGVVWFTVALVVSLVTASATAIEVAPTELFSRTRAVSRALEAETGAHPYSGPADAGELSLALPARTAVRRRYGDFVIEVTDHPDETAVRLGLAGARGTAPAWDQRLDGSWAATKRYGNDLFLIWRAEARGRLDERWRRIDAVMERVAQRTGQPAGASSSR